MVSFKIQIWGMQMFYKHTYDNAKFPYSAIKTYACVWIWKEGYKGNDFWEKAQNKHENAFLTHGRNISKDL